MITVTVSSPTDTKLNISDLFSLACFLSRKTEKSFFGLQLHSFKEIEDTSDTEIFDPNFKYYNLSAISNVVTEVTLLMATEKDVDEDCCTYTVILAEMKDVIS